MLEPLKAQDISKAVVRTRRVLTWKMVDGSECFEARQAAKGCQDPDLEDGNAGSSVCVGLRSSPLQIMALGAIEKWKIRSLEVASAFPLADGSGSAVILRPATERGSPHAQRIWKLRAPVAFRRSLRKYLLKSAG